jgi:large repetitive protein
LLAGTDPIGALNPTRPTVTNGRLNVANAITTGPRLSVSDASATEGAAGTTTTVTFNVTLSEANTQTVTVNFATANGTAAAPGDYTGTTGTLTFAPGVTSLPVAVTVAGDDQPEGNETFTLTLTAPVNAGIQDGQGVGTILNDDAPPTLSIGDLAANEGNNGTTAFAFRVRLSAPSGSPVTVQFATANGSATTGNKDYNATSGTLTIPAGQLEGTVTVQVRGDRRNEANETFTVNLSNPTNATVLGAQGIGTILNDD